MANRDITDVLRQYHGLQRYRPKAPPTVEMLTVVATRKGLRIGVTCWEQQAQLILKQEYQRYQHRRAQGAEC